ADELQQLVPGGELLPHLDQLRLHCRELEPQLLQAIAEWCAHAASPWVHSETRVMAPSTCSCGFSTMCSTVGATLLRSGDFLERAVVDELFRAGRSGLWVVQELQNVGYRLGIDHRYLLALPDRRDGLVAQLGHARVGFAVEAILSAEAALSGHP